MEKKIPYKIYLEENEMPKNWYNLRADMVNKPAPLLNPATLQPMTKDELSHVFCEELCEQELDSSLIDKINEKIIKFYSFPPEVKKLNEYKSNYNNLNIICLIII